MNHPTRFCLSLLLAGGLTAALRAQEAPPPPPEVSERSAEELDELLGPIALYPDDLVALILPAASEPADIVLAARYHENDGAMDEIDEQHWDESVRAIAHFPDVVEWMSKNLSWTQDIGDAFLTQPAEVMKSIQRLRAQAYAAGTLRDSEHQNVLVDGDVIRIVSAEEDVIYVPRYRTEVVYVDRPVYYSEPWITFGIGWTIGRWHRWECDWYSHRIWVFNDHDHWRSRRWNRNHVDIRFHWRNYDHGRAWSPPRTHVRYHRRDWVRDHNRNRHVNRPSPYVENDSRWRNRNRDRNQDGVDRTRREGLIGDRRNQERNGPNNNQDSNRGDRRARGAQGGRGTSDGGNPSVIVNQGATPATNPPTIVGNNRGRSSAGSGDRREPSRGSRNALPANPSRPPVVASVASSPPVANSSRTPSDRRASTQVSRQETGRETATNRAVRVYAPERGNPARNANSGYQSRSNASRSSASSSQQNPGSSASTNTTSASSGRDQGGANGGSERLASSDSGRSRNSDSGRSGDNGKGDDGGRGGRSNSGGGSRGR